MGGEARARGCPCQGLLEHAKRRSPAGPRVAPEPRPTIGNRFLRRLSEKTATWDLPVRRGRGVWRPTKKGRRWQGSTKRGPLDFADSPVYSEESDSRAGYPRKESPMATTKKGKRHTVSSGVQFVCAALRSHGIAQNGWAQFSNCLILRMPNSSPPADQFARGRCERSRSDVHANLRRAPALLGNGNVYWSGRGLSNPPASPPDKRSPALRR